MDLVQAAGVPMIAPSTVSPPKQPFVFSSAGSSAQMTRQTMRSLKDASLRRAALLIVDSVATEERLRIYREQATAHGVDLVAVEPFSMSETSLTGHLRALIGKAPDAILVAAMPPFNSRTALGLRALGWPGRIYCSPAAGHPAFLGEAGPAAEGVRVIAPWLLLAERAADTLPNAWAIHRFAAEFTPANGPVGTFVGYGADAVGMLHAAYVGHRDRARAREALEHMTYIGATGVFRRSPADHGGLDDAALTTIVVRNGTWAADDNHP
jgi:branched-chain amino acid transport system substrate-binding protein